MSRSGRIDRLLDAEQRTESAIESRAAALVDERLRAAPGVEEVLDVIADNADHDCTCRKEELDHLHNSGYRGCPGEPCDCDCRVARHLDALRAAIAADKARAVAAALEGAGRAEQFADAICARVGARDSGCGGQTGGAGTARLYADAAKRIDALIARAKTRPTPDEARSIGRVAEHLRGLAAEVEPSRMADGFEADRMRLLAHRLRQVAALMPDSDEARRLVEEFERACDAWQYREAEARTAARTALLRVLGVEA